MSHLRIQDEHHVVRLCRRNGTIRENGRVIAISSSTFELRAMTPAGKPETYLSAAYYELAATQANTPPATSRVAMGLCASYLHSKLPKRPDDAFFRLSVAAIRQVGKVHGRDLRVVHRPRYTGDIYAGINGMPPNPDARMNVELAAKTVVEIFP